MPAGAGAKPPPVPDAIAVSDPYKVVLDVAGKGVPAALVMSATRSVLRAYARVVDAVFMHATVETVSIDGLSPSRR